MKSGSRSNGKPWDKTPSARLPDEVIAKTAAKTAAKYQEALTRLMA